MNLTEQHTQWRQRALLLVGVLTLTVLAAWLLAPATAVREKRAGYDSLRLQDMGASPKVDPSDVWQALAEGDLAQLRQQNSEMTDELSELHLLATTLQAERSASLATRDGDREDLRRVIEAQAQAIERLRSDMGASRPYPATGISPGAGSPGGATVVTQHFVLEASAEPVVVSHDAREYVPAGAYSAAVVIAGVDASVGVMSQVDPRQVVFRLHGPAFGPRPSGSSESLTTDLDGCTVVGSANGDVSSEKVYVRLLTLSCAHGGDRIVERTIEGYAAAVGRSGIRGPVVLRAGGLAERAFWSGVVGGVGRGIQANYTQVSQTPFGSVSTATSSSAKEIAAAGIGEGVGSAGDALSEYFIERAEQYQPVISIPAGTEVELVFLNGFYRDGRDQSERLALGDRL